MPKAITAEEQQALNQILFNAAVNGDAAAIRQSLIFGAKIDARNEHQSTALHLAADNGQSAAVTALLEAGAEINVRNKWHKTPLHLAAWQGNNDTVKTLLAVGANLDSKNDDGTPINYARAFRDPNFARYMQSIVDGTTPRPTPAEVGLDMAKRNAALEALKKPVVGAKTAALDAGRDRQREAALNDPEQGI